MTQTQHEPEQGSPERSDPTARRSRSRLLGVLTAGLSVAVVITAIAVAAGRDDDESDTSSDTSGSGAQEQAPAAEEGGKAAEDEPPATSHDGVFTPGTATATMYYLGPENAATGRVLLFAEPHTVEQSDAETAVREFLTSRPIDPDYRSGWPEGVTLLGIDMGSGQPTFELQGAVDLSDPGALDKQAAQTAIQGLIRTAGITDGTAAFTYNGEPLTRLLGVDVTDGVPVQPEQSADFSVVTRAAIQVTSPVEGQTMPNPVVVTGNGNVFEGNVSWQLLDVSGQEIDSGFETTAMGEWVDFEVRLGRLEPGSYTFRAVEYSMEDGSEMSVDDKTFTVS